MREEWKAGGIRKHGDNNDNKAKSAIIYIVS